MSLRLGLRKCGSTDSLFLPAEVGALGTRSLSSGHGLALLPQHVQPLPAPLRIVARRLDPILRHQRPRRRVLAHRTQEEERRALQLELHLSRSIIIMTSMIDDDNY